MANLLNALRMQLIVLLCIMAMAGMSGQMNLLVAVLAAGLILIPEAFYVLAASRIMNSARSRLGRALSARMLKLIGTVVFLALSLRMIEAGSLAAASVWIATVVGLMLTPVVYSVLQHRHTEARG